MKLTQEFLEEQKQILMKEWHPTKNNPLTFQEMLTKNQTQKCWWQCEHGHEWEARPYQRMKGTRCPYCRNRKLLIGFNDLATTHPQLAKEWHPTKNESLTPFEVSKGSGQVVWWLGSCGHEWKAMVGNRARGAKCPYCAQKRKIENKSHVSKVRKPRKSVISETNNLTISHPALIQYWHPIKNGDLTPKQVLKSSRAKVWWQCSKGHEWELSIHGAVRRLELNGVECLHCHHEKKKKQTNPNIQ